MGDLLFPSTDAGVFLQVAVVLAFGVLALVATRGRKEWRLVAIGATILALALLGLRALH